METKPPIWEPPPVQAPQYPTSGRAAPSQRYVYPQQAVPANNEGWFERNQKNKPQSNSVGAGALIFTSGGMSMAWGLGFYPITNSEISIYMNVCWFVMAIVGAAVSAALTNVVKKKIFMLLSTLLVLLGGILFLSLYDHYDALMAARHLNGFSIGLLFVPVLVMGGEEAAIEVRGMITSSIEMMCFSLGVYLQIIYSVCWESVSGFTANQLHGTILICFSVISLIFVGFLIVESPVYYLVRNHEQVAIDCLRRLKQPPVVTYETYVQLEALKSYIAYNKEMSRCEAWRSCLPALFKLSILRAIVGMSFSLVINLALIYASFISTGSAWSILSAIIYGTCLYFGTFVSVFMQDSVGRKKLLAFGMLISGGLAIAIAICFTGYENMNNKANMTAAMWLLISYQFFVGLGITSSSPYLSEAFPLAIKPYCIAITFTVEMLAHILCATIDISSDSYCQLCYVLGVVSLAYFLLTIYCLPETKKTSLLDAQIKFKGWCSSATH